MAKEVKGKGFTGRTAAWIGLASAAVVGLYFWAQRGKGETLKCHYTVNHIGPADNSLKARIRIGVWNGVYWDTREELVSVKPFTPLEDNDVLSPVKGNINFIIPTSAAPSEALDIEFCILNADGTEYTDGLGKTKDRQENKIELLGAGKFNLV